MVDLNNYSIQVTKKSNDIIYDLASDASTVYIVRSGRLVMETSIEIDNYFRFPVDRQKWQVRKTTRQICYRLQELKKGAIFGHEEILQGGKRRCRVRSYKDCTLIAIKEDYFKNRWPRESTEVLRATMRNLDLDFIVSKIERFYKKRKLQNTAVLDASKLNCQDYSGSRYAFLESVNQTQIDKMLAWMNKARQNATNNTNLLHELRKVTIVMQKEEIIDPTHVQSTDLARFVLPDETNHEANMQEAVKKNLVARTTTLAPDKIGGQEL